MGKNSWLVKVRCIRLYHVYVVSVTIIEHLHAKKGKEIVKHSIVVENFCGGYKI